MKVQELLSDESKWTQHVFAKNSQGVPTDSTSPFACRWCLIGAVNRCYPTAEERRLVLVKLNSALGNMGHPKTYIIVDYNDTHTFPEIKKLVDALDI